MSWISTESFEEDTLRPESCSSTSTNWSNHRHQYRDQDWPSVTNYTHANNFSNKYATISSSSSLRQQFKNNQQKRSKSPPHQFQGHHHQDIGHQEVPKSGRRKLSTAFEQVFSYFKSLEQEPPTVKTSDDNLIDHPSTNYNPGHRMHSGMHNSWTSTSGFESMTSSSNPRYSSHDEHSSEHLTPTPGTSSTSRSHRSSSLGHALTQQQQQHLYQQMPPDQIRIKSGHSHPSSAENRNSYPGHGNLKPVPNPKPNLGHPNIKPAPPKPPRKSLAGAALMEVFGDHGTGSGDRRTSSRSFHPSHQHSLKNVNPNMSKSQHQLNTWYSRTIDWVEGVNDATFGGFEDGPYSLPAPPEGYGNVSNVASAMKRSASNDAVEDFDPSSRTDHWRTFDDKRNSFENNVVRSSNVLEPKKVDVSNLYAEVIKPKRSSNKENKVLSTEQNFTSPNIPSSSSAFSTFRGNNNNVNNISSSRTSSESNNQVINDDPYPRLNRIISSHNQSINNSSSQVMEGPVYSKVKKENPYESIKGQRSSGIYDEVAVVPRHAPPPPPPTVPMHQSQVRRGQYSSNNGPTTTTGYNVQRSSSSSKIPNVVTVPNVSNYDGQQPILQPAQVLEQLQQLQGHRRPQESSHVRSKSEHHHSRCPQYAHVHDVTTGEVVVGNNSSVVSGSANNGHGGNGRSPYSTSNNVHNSSSSQVSNNVLNSSSSSSNNPLPSSNHSSWSNGHYPQGTSSSGIPRRMSGTNVQSSSSIANSSITLNPSLEQNQNSNRTSNIMVTDAGNQSALNGSSSSRLQQTRLQNNSQFVSMDHYNNGRQYHQDQQLNQHQLPSRRKSLDDVLADDVVYARIPPPPPPDVALKRIRSVIKPLFQEYKEEKKMRPKDVDTMIEEKYFSNMEAKSGKKVLISNRVIGFRISKQLFPDKSMVTDPVPDDFWAVSEKENHGGSQRPSKQSIDDGKKSLRRNKHGTSHFGTAERKKKHKLSTLPRNHKTGEGHNHSKSGSSEERDVPGHPQTVILVDNIDIDNDPGQTFSKSLTEKSRTELGTSDIGKQRSPSGRSPIERSLSCDLRPPNISPFDGQKEWAAIESIMATFVTQTSTTTNTSSDQIESDNGTKMDKQKMETNSMVKSSEITEKDVLKKKPEVPKRPSLAPKPKIPSKCSPMSMSLDSRPSGSTELRTESTTKSRSGSRSPFFDTKMSVFDWTKKIGLHESIGQILVDHGFDDLRFMGPNVLELNDLTELNIINANDQRTILEHSKNLPLVPKLSSNCDNLTIKSWLNSLNLIQYEERFIENGFVDMEKVRKIWEVELNCVLDINKLGHRKRILASLGETISLINDLGLEDLDLDKMSIGLGLLSGKN